MEMVVACSRYGVVDVSSGLWWVNLSVRDCMENTGEVGIIVLRWIFRMLDVRATAGSIGTG